MIETEHWDVARGVSLDCALCRPLRQARRLYPKGQIAVLAREMENEDTGEVIPALTPCRVVEYVHEDLWLRDGDGDPIQEALPYWCEVTSPKAIR